MKQALKKNKDMEFKSNNNVYEDYQRLEREETFDYEKR